MQAFTDHYYNTFDTNRQGLAGLYQDQSMLTFEGQKFQGPQQVCRATVVSPPITTMLTPQYYNLYYVLQILQKLTSLPFQACQHRVSSLDAQPSIGGGILVFVTGQLLV